MPVNPPAPWAQLPPRQVPLPQRRGLLSSLCDCFRSEPDAYTAPARRLVVLPPPPPRAWAPRPASPDSVRSSIAGSELSPDVLAQIAMIDNACLGNDPEAVLAGDDTALSNLIDERCARHEAQSVLGANPNTLGAFVLATHAARRSQALSADDVECCSVDAMVLIPRLAVLDCLEAVRDTGEIPLELFHSAPESGTESDSLVQDLQAALRSFLSDNAQTVEFAVALLRGRLLGADIPEPMNTRITPLFDALCKVSDFPMSSQARAFTLLLQHTLMSL